MMRSVPFAGARLRLLLCAALAATLSQPIAPVSAWTDNPDLSRDSEREQQSAGWPVGTPQMTGQRQDDMIVALAQPGVVSNCLPGELRAVIGKIEQHWGRVEVISTHRPGARVRGSGRPSRHATCEAIDFRPPSGTFRQVASWLKQNHDGGVGTYSGRHNHIHIDTGPRYRWHN